MWYDRNIDEVCDKGGIWMKYVIWEVNKWSMWYEMYMNKVCHMRGI